MIKIRHIIFAQAASLDANGKLNILGAFTTIAAEGVPATINNWNVAISFTAEAEDMGKTFPFAFWLVNSQMPEDLKPEFETDMPERMKKYDGIVLAAEGDITIGIKNPNVSSEAIAEAHVLTPLDSIRIPAFGRHRFIVEVKDGPSAETELAFVPQEN